MASSPWNAAGEKKSSDKVAIFNYIIEKLYDVPMGIVTLGLALSSALIASFKNTADVLLDATWVKRLMVAVGMKLITSRNVFRIVTIASAPTTDLSGLPTCDGRPI